QVEVGALAGELGERVQVQLDAQAGGLGEREVPIDDLGQAGRHALDRRVGEVVEVLLDLEVGRAGAQVQVRGGQHGAADVVRGDHDVVRLGGGGEFAGLADAADVADVRLDDVDGL